MGRPLTSPRVATDAHAPGMYASITDYTTSLIDAYQDPASLAYTGLVFNRNTTPAIAAKRRVSRLRELLASLEAGATVRVQRGSVPPEFRRLLPAGTPLDWYIIYPSDDVLLEEPRSSR